MTRKWLIEMLPWRVRLAHKRSNKSSRGPCSVAVDDCQDQRILLIPLHVCCWEPLPSFSCVADIWLEMLNDKHDGFQSKCVNIVCHVETCHKALFEGWHQWWELNGFFSKFVLSFLTADYCLLNHVCLHLADTWVWTVILFSHMMSSLLSSASTSCL